MKRRRSAEEKLDAIYRRIPAMQCKRLCQQACGPILVTKTEHGRLAAVAGTTALRSDARTLLCPLLKDGACTAYGVRPTICRLFGVSRGMPCPFGCEPERWLTDQETRAIMHAAARVGGSLIGILPPGCEADGL